MTAPGDGTDAAEPDGAEPDGAEPDGASSRPGAHWPVSVKGVVIDGDRVLLARNDRGEWELPGGRLEHGETPAECVVREVDEECGLQVAPRALLDAWVFEVVPGRSVLIVAYACDLRTEASALRGSSEHDAVAFIPLSALDRINVPAGYRAAIGHATESPTGGLG